jgi:hypothetical protein
MRTLEYRIDAYNTALKSLEQQGKPQVCHGYARIIRYHNMKGIRSESHTRAKRERHTSNAPGVANQSNHLRGQLGVLDAVRRYLEAIVLLHTDA